MARCGLTRVVEARPGTLELSLLQVLNFSPLQLQSCPSAQRSAGRETLIATRAGTSIVDRMRSLTLLPAFHRASDTRER